MTGFNVLTFQMVEHKANLVLVTSPLDLVDILRTPPPPSHSHTLWRLVRIQHRIYALVLGLTMVHAHGLPNQIPGLIFHFSNNFLKNRQKDFLLFPLL